MKKQIAILAGDGIGPEITTESIRILKKIAQKFGHSFIFKEALIGGVAIDQTGDPFPQDTEQLCLQSDAILFGAIGDPKYDNNPKASVRPEQGLLKMRKTLGLYINIRPIFLFPELLNRSPLKPEIIKGTDFVIIRELTGGIYFGKRGRSADKKYAFDTSEYSVMEIERVLKYSFELSTSRRKKLTLIDKANVLETSRLWRESAQKMSDKYPDVSLEFMFVDNASQQIIKNPANFDVIVTENMFGDILSDEASVITGSLGMLPSASLGDKTSLFEPIHGSFPRAAGLNIANPAGSILSAAMLLDYSFGLKNESKSISTAVNKVLSLGYGTKDISNDKILGTKEFGDKVLDQI